ncbi:MAG: vitamin K epoxide reductase family protein [bacterium]|nr:vitamin K epoxide reductase family protein [bacterium]
MNRLAVWLILLLAFFGLSDSAYLAQSEMGGDPLICDFTTLTGCNIVTQSPYSHLFGLPLADFGIAFFGLLFILAAVEVMFVHVNVRRTIQALSAVGLIASAYFMFVQLSVIDALCVYCTASGVISFLIFIFAYFIEPLSPKNGAIEMPSPHTRSRLVLPPPSV